MEFHSQLDFSQFKKFYGQYEKNQRKEEKDEYIERDSF